jgi:hypothetical protein
MQLDILKQLSKTVEKDKLLEMYNVATGEKITQEEIDLALKPKKKPNILVVEKELLSSYMEAVADMKKLNSFIAEYIDSLNGIGYEKVANDEFDKYIKKHVERIRNSGIWD